MAVNDRWSVGPDQRKIVFKINNLQFGENVKYVTEEGKYLPEQKGGRLGILFCLKVC
ncbi:hypothetical protein [Uliginosibacterium flavum]|uniref:Uncharacterized protein n=1 Tax=Uliginosibacterium flavum TaxID=1396831 RepID=A0ABV2TGU4_9RHOO